MLSRLPLSELLDAFASSAPTPGGGSAAALSGAVGASLLAMVAGLPKTRDNTDEDRQALDTARTELTALTETLETLIDRDADSYDAVVAAYRLPKATDEDKAARQAAIQQALQLATSVPLETVGACATAIDLARTVARHGNLSAISDIAVGVQTLMTGLSGALMNVQINLDSVKDSGFRDRVGAEARGHLERAGTAMRDIMTSREFAEFARKGNEALGLPPHGPTRTVH